MPGASVPDAGVSLAGDSFLRTTVKPRRQYVRQLPVFGGGQRKFRVAIVDSFRPGEPWDHGRQVRAVLETMARAEGLAVEVREFHVEHRDGYYHIGEGLQKVRQAVQGGERFDAMNLSMGCGIAITELAGLLPHLSLTRDNLGQKRQAILEGLASIAGKNPKKPLVQTGPAEKETAGELAQGLSALKYLVEEKKIKAFVASGNHAERINLFSLPPGVRTVGRAAECNRRPDGQPDPARNNPFITRWQNDDYIVPDGAGTRKVGGGPSFATPAELVWELAHPS